MVTLKVGTIDNRIAGTIITTMAVVPMAMVVTPGEIARSCEYMKERAPDHVR